MVDQHFKHIKNIRLSDQAVEQIQALIVNGHFEPGSKLPSESELVTSLQVSRSSIREALRMLESRGVVQVRSGSGAYVADEPFSFHAMGEAIEWLVMRKESLVQLLEVREVLEGFATNLLANHVTDDILKELQQNIDLQKSALHNSPDADAISNIGLEFHKIIARASGNQFADGFIQSIVSRLSCSNRAIVYVSSGSEASTHEHTQILAALRDKNPALAEKEMRKHLSRARLDLINLNELKETESNPA